jgi:thiamine biosynthesis lipoprotein
MNGHGEQSRREFLTGRGAAKALTGRLQKWADQRLRPATAGVTVHVRATRRAMACDFEVQYHAADVQAAESVTQAFDLVEAIESQLTIYRDSSEVIEMNRHAAAGPRDVELRLFSLLALAGRLYRDTHGAFDITSTPLSRTWGFLRRAGRVPSPEEIAAALKHVGFEKVSLDTSCRTIRFFEPDVEINFNSLGKGYALDRAAAHLDELGMRNYLWHGGRSSVLARGRNRADANECWTVGLPNPARPAQRLAELYLRDRALGTAGGGTQFFQHEGNTYSHVLDPRTGWPAQGVYTATALARTAAEADALATAFFVMGPTAVGEYCENHPEIAAILACPAELEDDVALYSWGLGKDDWQRF